MAKTLRTDRRPREGVPVFGLAAKTGMTTVGHLPSERDYDITTKTTRRFWARPSGLSLGATGLASPYEMVLSRFSATPWPLR